MIPSRHGTNACARHWALQKLSAGSRGQWGGQTRIEGDRTMKRRTWWVATLAAVAVLLAASATAFGYQSQVKGSVTVAGKVTCDAPFTLTATFVDANGQPVAGQSVDWSFLAGSASDKINKTPTVTDAKGVATTTVRLGPVTIARTVQAIAGTIKATAVLNASCGSGGVLPNTSTLPAEAPSQGTPFAALAVAGLALAFVGSLDIRRVASADR
jgi:Bacterial Ig-like domain (group 1)